MHINNKVAHTTFETEVVPFMTTS